MKKILFPSLISLLSLSTLTFVSASTNIWETLFKVKWYKKYSDVMKEEIEFPIFSPEIKALDGKEITITGYLVPSEMYGGDTNYCIISAYPASNCFFCGQAGPETVMEVYPQKKKMFQGSKFTVKGRLKLNPNDPDHLIYILEDAVQIESER
ncbi:MAG: hypothetical protein OHK0057_29140 [Thermoflexibacter sp.]